MRRLEAAVREVRRELELTLERVGLVRDPPALNLEREAEDVFTAYDDELLKLFTYRGARGSIN